MVYVYVLLGDHIPRLCEAGMGMRPVVGVANLSSCLKSNDNGKSLREGPLCLRYNRGDLHTHAGEEDNIILKCAVQVCSSFLLKLKQDTIDSYGSAWFLTKVV